VINQGGEQMGKGERMLHLHSNPLRRTVHDVDLHHSRHARSGLSCIATRRRRSVLDLGPAVHVLPHRWASAGNVHGGRLAIGIRAAALQLTTVQASLNRLGSPRPDS
jgi:hypothetical protein